MKMNSPSLKEEKKLWKNGYKRVACLDEAGRGPLAGPVVAAAVAIADWRTFLRRRSVLLNIKDSKQLSPKKREEFYKLLTNHPAIVWGIGIVSEKVIDKINILEATKLAIKRAVENLNKKLLSHKSYDRRKCGIVDFLVLDGNFKINSKIPQKSIIKADEKVFSCAAASIIAKVTRDRIMKAFHRKYPQYGFDKHKGYGTSYHYRMIKRYGFCKIHRKTFKLL